MDELCTLARKEPGGLLSNDSPVSDRYEMGVARRPVHLERRNDSVDGVGAARVLDVVENRMAPS